MSWSGGFRMPFGGTDPDRGDEGFRFALASGTNPPHLITPDDHRAPRQARAPPPAQSPNRYKTEDRSRIHSIRMPGNFPHGQAKGPVAKPPKSQAIRPQSRPSAARNA